MTAEAPSPATDVLVVCTANIGRSPLLEARLAAEADRRLGPGVVRVASAGTDARVGDRAAANSCVVAEGWGLSLNAHASRSLMYEPLKAVTLVLGMTGQHVRALTARGAVPGRTFTVPELVAAIDVARDAGDLPDPPPCPDPARARDHLAAVVAAADRHRPSRWRRRRFEVPDPIGGDMTVYERLGARFDRDATVLADALFGPLPT